ncbi:MAG: YadA-like family protein [Deltaproteobacteria bacterium]|nr:YadA-like family protein [Candidatus Anaeroferrophillus wilburensis]
MRKLHGVEVMRVVVLIGILCCVFSGSASWAAEVIPEDLIVEGGLAVGTAAAVGDSFSFITLQLHEDNTRLLFNDASELSGYPNNDWILKANDSNNGGQNYFAIVDAGAGDPTGDSGTPVLRVDAGAPANTIRAYQNGDISLGGANVANTISVGSAGFEGTISNVAAGTNTTDAVNYGQLVDVQTQVTNNDSDIAANTDNIAINAAAIASSSAAMSFVSTGTSGASSATGTGSLAIGSGASARTNDIAIGLNSTVTADGSTALGTNTAIDSTNSVAVGADAVVEADAAGGTAIGQNTIVRSGATNSVALGKDSVASEANTVSVGSSGNERRITNIADGIDANDAATVGQLQGTMTNIDTRIDKLDDRVDDVGSLASAFSALVPNTRALGNTQIALGVGHYSGSNALAAGMFHYVSDKIMVNAAVSTTFNNNGTATRAGITFGF